jgi:fibronectin type 3 domain-containing protein
MTTLTGDSDRFLAAGIYGYEWANIAEIMRTYGGWAAADVTHFQNWLLTIYYPMSHDFLVNHNGAAISNYWANWDLCNMADVEAIGVFCDRQDLYNEAIDNFYHGAGNGAIDKLLYYVHDGYLGQGQESGRDQGHSTLDLSLMGAIMQMAWNQGDDLFGYENNKFLMVAEYINKYNLGYNVPFETYSWLSGQSGPWMQQTVISGGAGSFRPNNELIYNHYVNVLGLAAPYTTAARNAHSPEGGSSNGDELGFGTLTYSLDPIGPGQKPSGLTAEEVAGGVTLNWWGEPYATSYTVYRSTSASGPFTRIAGNITGTLTYTDQPSSPGVYFYEVTGTEPGGETAPSNIVRGATVPVLHTQLLFNESGGTTANDASGNGNNGTLMNGASFTGSAVRLTGSGQYVSLPTGLVSNLADFTIAAWVNLASNPAWARVFDIGDSNGRYMFLTPITSSGKVRFAFGLNYEWDEQDVDGTAPLPTNQWVHVAVTQSGRTVTLYVNGVAVGSTVNQDFQPFQLGATVNNWIGRSQYPADPYLNGQVKDFRIYHGALSANDVYTLATGGPYGSVLAAPASATAWTNGDGSVGVRWAAATGAASYNIYRSTTSGGPYTTVATGVLPNRFIDTGLANGVPYFYVVSAVNAAGESLRSTEVSATPAAPAMPAAPTGLTAAAGNGVVFLNWTASSGALSYNVKRAAVAGGPYTNVATWLPTTSFIDRGLSNGTAYYYVVTAVNASNVESPNSPEVSGTPTPAGWNDADIGSPAVPGYTRYDGLTWTVAGSGSDIWNNSDQFHFASRSLSGNGSIVARVTGVQNTDANAKAGVMFRDSAAASAMYVLVAVSPGAGIKFEYRNSTGGSAASAGNVTGLTAPAWVRLTRNGNVFSGYYSADGVTWTQIGGNITITMSANPLVGLAVTAHNSSHLCTSTFDNVSVYPRLQLTLPATVTAGVPFSVTVTAQDAVNHTNTGYTGTVHFTASNGFSANYTFTAADMGQHTFSGLVLTHAWTYTVTGADTANPFLTGGTTFTVAPAAPAHIALVLPPTISAGVPFSVTVTVQDAYGNTVTGYTGTVHFQLTGPVMPAVNYTFTAADMGSRTFNNLALSETGTYTLTATDTMDAMLTGTVLFTVM